MNWTEPKLPTEGISSYDHVICETPLGQCLIEWKGWKDSDSYVCYIGDIFIGNGLDLDDAKILTKEWLVNKNNELSSFIGL